LAPGQADGVDSQEASGSAQSLIGLAGPYMIMSIVAVCLNANDDALVTLINVKLSNRTGLLG